MFWLISRSPSTGAEYFFRGLPSTYLFRCSSASSPQLPSCCGNGKAQFFLSFLVSPWNSKPRVVLTTKAVASPHFRQPLHLRRLCRRNSGRFCLFQQHLRSTSILPSVSCPRYARMCIADHRKPCTPGDPRILRRRFRHPPSSTPDRLLIRCDGIGSLHAANRKVQGVHCCWARSLRSRAGARVAGRQRALGRHLGLPCDHWQAFSVED